MVRKLVGLVVVLFGLLLTSGRVGVASAQGPIDWQDKVDPAVLAAAALGETDFLIYMTEQADLSGADELSDKVEKGTYVYEQLTATAQQSQAPVITLLDTLGVTYQPFWIVNTIAASGNLVAIEAIASLSEVAYLYPHTEATLDLPTVAAPEAPAPQGGGIEWNIELTNAPDAWALGYSGQGVVVAGADTGVFWEHPALMEKYRGWDGTDADHNYNWHDSIPVPNGFCPGNSPEPCDDDEVLGGGHGTHTVGTMVGGEGANGIGMAPDAEWIACRNMNYGVGVVVTYLDCLEWFLAPTDLNDENPDPAQAPHVINNSWGCLEGCPPEILRDSVASLREAGIVYVVSAGNDGPECSTIAFPTAIYPEGFTVGATDINDLIADFSSRGPVLTLDPLNPFRKPDISAPGVDIRSSLKDGSYGALSGTSMAGPHVAGLVALVISANPTLAGNVDQIEYIIEQTAVPLTTDQGCGEDSDTDVPNNVYGYGRIDALAAVEAASTPTAIQLDGLASQTDSGTPYALWLAGGLVAALGLALLVRRTTR